MELEGEGPADGGHSAGPVVSRQLTEEEKAAARTRKAAKRAAKAAALSQEDIAEAEARRERIAKRDEVRVSCNHAARHRRVYTSTSATRRPL
jgi:hypothetical protein